MGEILFTEDYYEYKDGFANGLLDLIINSTTNFNFKEDIEYNSLWDLGYIDAYDYYDRKLQENKTLELSNVSHVINEFYIQRIARINEEFEEEIPAFTILLKSIPKRKK